MKPGLNKAFKRLEPYDAKVSRTVLRGRRFGQPNFCYPTLIFTTFLFKNMPLAAVQASCHSCAAQDLQQESMQQVENLQKDPAFQEIVTELQDSASKGSTPFKDPSKKGNGELYIFISFSMGEKALVNLAHEAKRFGATLVLRGFRDGSYIKTAQSLQNMITKTGQGVLIDPELYSLFAITAVPTFVLAKPFPLQSQERTQTPIHDKLQGHVSVKYALETFEKEGDLKDEAHALLHRGAIK